MPAGQGPDERDRGAERFAAAVEQGRSLGSVDAELSHDLEIVAMLRSRSAAYSPDPDAKARAKQRLMAALAVEPPMGAPAAAEQTAPMGRILAPAFPVNGQVQVQVGLDLGQVDIGGVDAAARTMQMAAVTTETPGTAESPATTEAPAADDASAPVPIRSGRRSGRHTMPSRPGTRRARSATPGLRRRASLVGTAALVTMIALAGAGVFASRDALPGDALYALKRAAESAGLALTFDEQAKARRHLELASTRLDEIERLTARQSQSPADAALLQAAMQEFESATGEGSRMLLAGEDAGGAAALGDLRTWAAEQVARLSVLRSALPVPAMADADESIDLLDRLLGRTEALQGRSNCIEVTSNRVDDIGPLPAEGTCAPRPADPAAERPSIAGGDESATTTPGTAGGSPGSSTDGQDAGGPAQDGGGLVPGVQDPDLGTLPGSGSTEDAGSSATTTAPAAGGGDNVSVPVPLPLMPPITLPPMVPGQPGITIG